LRLQSANITRTGNMDNAGARHHQQSELALMSGGMLLVQ
jgi:hypothetical protein